ncbi:hypothetical protein MCEREM30_01344 [Paracoccaceae bacterium]
MVIQALSIRTSIVFLRHFWRISWNRGTEVVNKKSAYEDVEDLVRSLKNMITVLIDLFPEGNGETFDEDAYLTILEKAQDDAKALMILVQKMNH